MFDDTDNFVFGDPQDQSDFWELQNQPDNCAVASELSIMHQFGINLTQDQANYISAENGWYHPGGGTTPDDVGNMMTMYNIPNHTRVNATAADLARELQQGHGVIVGVNNEDLYDYGPLQNLFNAVKDDLGFSSANHAVVVTGIDASDPEHPMVVLNDPGHPDGQGATYPLDQFMDAWQNSDFYYTATDQAIPHNDLNSIEQIDFSKWLGVISGAIVGAGTWIGTGDLSTAGTVGLATANYVENFFADPDSIRMV